jgi:ATP-dependent Clp protease ATP-binding subunit ClpX
MFEMDGVKLTFDDDTLDYIVQKAIDLKLGARGLRSIVEEIMTQYMYDIPSQKKKKLNVTKEYAESVINSKMVIKEATV